MALVRSNNNNRRGVNNAFAALGSIIAAALNGDINTTPYRNAWETGKAIGGYLKGPQSSPGNSAPPQSSGGGGGGNPGSGRSGRTRRRGKGREKKQSRNNLDAYRTIGFGPAGQAPSIRTRLSAVIGVTTNASGAYSQAWTIGYENGASWALLTLFPADNIKLISAFEKGMIHRVTAKFVGTASSTTPGFVGLAFDSSTITGVAAPASIQDVVGTNQLAQVSDVKGECSLTYVPKGTDREIRTLDTGAPNTEKSAGRFTAFVSGTGLTAGAYAGLLYVEVDITLLQ